MPVIRTWGCLNRRCGSEFESWEPAPTCPKCRGVRVHWVPGGGHTLSAATQHNDRTLKAVAKRFGLTDLGQKGGTHAGERAEPNLRAAKPMGPQQYSPMPGFNVGWSNKPTAGWASEPYPLKTQMPTGRARFKAGSKRIPTHIVATDPRKVSV